MQYYTYQPSEKLRDFIQFYWAFEADTSQRNPIIHPSTASGSAKLAFQYQGRFHLQHANGTDHTLFTSGLEAQTRSFQKMVAYERIGVFGIYFYPCVLPLLLTIPAHELSNQNIEVSLLFGQAGKVLEDQVMSAQSNRERVNIVNAFFEKRIASIRTAKPGIIAAIQHIIHQKGMVNIDELIRNNCLSQRQFERNFKALSGFSPKMFSRITRFESSLHLLFNQPLSLTEAAFASGYYDQPHFIRDFREFAGQSPREYFAHELSMFASE